MDAAPSNPGADQALTPTLDGSASLSAIPQSVPLPPVGAEAYTISGEIARGGMGRILAAQDLKLGRSVAMKVMTLEADASEHSRNRFIREATVLARLAHPNIVPIHDLGRDANNRLFYTMKLVQGRTLGAILHALAQRERQTLAQYTLDRLLTIFRKVCDALALAHSKGIIHRDLKPDNIMVGEFGEVLVMDWGLARILGDVAQHAEESPERAPWNNVPEMSGLNSRNSMAMTLDGTVMGTPNYMPPEQACGKIDAIDQQSDIFSLGAILYAILTLHPPVEAGSVSEVMERIKLGNISPPTSYNVAPNGGNKGTKSRTLVHCPGGKVPAALSAVAMRALSPEKSDRYPTVMALAAEIEAWQGGFATSAERAGLLTQLSLLIRRHKQEFAIGFSAWLLITVLAVWFVINLRSSERRANRNADLAQRNERQSNDNARLAQANAVAAAHHAQVAAENEKHARDAEAQAVRDKESARKSLAQAALNLAEAAQREGNGPAMQAALAEVPEDLRDSTWTYLLQQSDTSIARAHLGGMELHGVAANPRVPGVFAVAAKDGRVIVLNIHSGQRLLEFESGVVRVNRIHLQLAYSPDGERIAVGQRGGTGGIVIHNAHDGKKVLQWDAPLSRQLEFSPDGKLLMQLERDGSSISVWDANTARLCWNYLPRANSPAIRAAFTPDGRYLITHERYDDHVRLVNAQDGKLVRKLCDEVVSSLAVRPDGAVLVMGMRAGRIKGISLIDGSVLFDFHAHNRDVTQLAFTPDGLRLLSMAVYADGRQALHLWNAYTGSPQQTLLGGTGVINDAVVHPLSGELLITGPTSRAWNLTGTPEKWALHGICNGLAFWGSDDLLFAPAGDSWSPLLQLRPGGTQVLWKPPAATYRQATVSADGRLAAMIQQHSILILRKRGPSVEQTGTFKSNFSTQTLRLSPTGDHLAMIEAYGVGVALFDTKAGKESAILESRSFKRYHDLRWLDDRCLAGLVTADAERGNPGSHEWIVIWDVTTRKIIHADTNATAMDVLAVSPDGQRLAEAGVDQRVRIRDAQTLGVVHEFRAHDAPITALAWHPNQPIIATASADLSIRLWNLETGMRLDEFRGPLLAPTELVFSPSGRRLACAAERVASVWEPRSLNEAAGQSPAEGEEDLLASLTRVTVAKTGNGWRLKGGALLSAKDALLPLPGNFTPSSYHLRLTLRQINARGLFHLTLPVGKIMAGLDLDDIRQRPARTSLSLVDASFSNAAAASVPGKQVQDLEQHDLQVTVRVEANTAHIDATLDDAPLLSWSGPMSALTVAPPWNGSPAGTIAIGALYSDWVVCEARVKSGKRNFSRFDKNLQLLGLQRNEDWEG